MSFMSSFKENNVHLWIRASKPLTGDVRNNWVSGWGISVLTSTAWGFATLTRTTHQNSVTVPGLTCQTTAHNSAPNWEQGPVRWSCDGWSWCRVVCVCVSGKPAASGQHRVQRPRPEGAAAAWQGMNQITPLFLCAARQPTLSVPRHPCLGLYTIVQPGIPIFSTQRTFLPWRKGCVFLTRSLWRRAPWWMSAGGASSHATCFWYTHPPSCSNL